MSKELQSWFKELPIKLQRELAKDLKEIADGLAEDIRRVTPEGETGNLRSSVRVRRGRRTLEYFVEAGGVTTTKEVRQGSGVQSDYALHVEFGTSKMSPQPFFYSTYNERRADVRREVEEAVANALGKA